MTSVRVGHVTNVTSGAPLGRILRNSSGHVTGHETRHFRSRHFLSRDFRLLYLAPHPQIWLELSRYTTLLEELSVEISPILIILFNKSVTTCIVPSDWRTAHVSPVYKKGQKYNPENYRPISLTCICCKLLEHLIVKHILSHADTHNILYPLQHGFRTGRSCETQLLEFIDDVTLNMENGKQTDILVMDFSKAFDKVSHSLLLHKLHYYDIQGELNSWIQNFLSNRKQAIVQGDKSDYVAVE